MSEQEIIEGNKLIAEFMEYEHSDILYDEENEEYFFDTDHLVCVEDIEVWESSVDDWTSTLSPEQMLFHSSWDWLMPVWFGILKWGKSEYGINWEQSIGEMFIHIKINKGELEINWLNTNRIEDVWFVVVEFIKWYNSCQKE